MRKIANLRVLTPLEETVITRALEQYANMALVPSSFKWAAQSMLEQKMPEHFFWATYSEVKE